MQTSLAFIYRRKRTKPPLSPSSPLQGMPSGPGSPEPRRAASHRWRNFFVHLESRFLPNQVDPAYKLQWRVTPTKRLKPRFLSANTCTCCVRNEMAHHGKSSRVRFSNPHHADCDQRCLRMRGDCACHVSVRTTLEAAGCRDVPSSGPRVPGEEARCPAVSVQTWFSRWSPGLSPADP